VRTVAVGPSFESWQAEARALLAAEVAPAEVRWEDASVVQATLPGLTMETPVLAAGAARARVPRRFLDLARQAAAHRDPQRWSLLYRVLWRLTHGEPQLLGTASDEDVVLLQRLAQPGERAALDARPFIPQGAGLEELRRAAASCQGCDLFRRATQTVFGEGPPDARVVLVGEQPGDVEDQRARPFVGPAGEVLDNALVAAGLERRQVYLTNVVKHFKFEERGKRRIHVTPARAEVVACHPWLEAELGAIRPRVVLCLGATAATALLGPQFRLMRQRGEVFRRHDAPPFMATIHPSAVLRAADERASEDLYGLIVRDLVTAARVAAEEPAPERAPY
jgi:uracil-DNA glycosylase family protein